MKNEKIKTPFSSVGCVTFKRTYARRLNEEDKNSPTESFEQTIDRVILACNTQLNCGFEKFEQEELRKYFLKLKGSPAGRFLWQLGTTTVDKLGLASLQNCAGCAVDHPIDPFVWTMDMLMLGSGVGYNIQKKYVDKIPPVKENFTRPTRHDKEDADFIVPDTREGWVKLLGRVLKSAFLAEGKNTFTFSTQLIRGKGAPIKGFGGVASGPEELVWGIDEIGKILEKRKGKKLRPIDCLDIMNIIGFVVVAGNVRRCHIGSTEVSTREGLIPIKDIVVGTEVLTTDGYRKVTAKFEQGVQSVIKIKTQDGFIEVTPNHRMAILTNVDEYRWVEAKDLKAGDRLCVSRESLEGVVTQLPSWSYVKPQHSTTCADIHIPELDSDMAWFLGLFHADGYTFANRKENGLNGYVSLVFQKDEEDIAQRAKTQLERFGISVTLKERKGENSLIVLATSKQLAWYFDENFKKPKTTLRVPDCIKRGTRDIRLAYCCGVMDGDGATNNRPVQVVSTVYKSFAKEIQNLLYSCGIESRLKEGKDSWKSRKNWQKQYTVSLISMYAKEAVQNCGFLEKNITLSQKAQYSNGYPSEWFSSSGYTRDLGCSNKQVSTDKYSSVISAPQLVPVEITEIVDENHSEMTWDIEVEDKHEFFADGYLSHNSAQIAIGDCDDVEFLLAKRWDIGNIPKWRGMSNNSVACDNINDLHEFFWDGYEGKGEPYGLINFRLTRKCGRTGETDYPDTNVVVFNPCQPEFATVLTQEGVKQFKDIQIGSKIWSSQGWTTVVNKWSNGVKPVYRYETTGGEFIGTENHRVVCPEGKIEVENAEKIMTIAGPVPNKTQFDWQVVLDGLFLGDGYHKKMKDRDYTYPILLVGHKDHDYFNHEELKSYLTEKPFYDRVEENCSEHRCTTTITVEEKQKTFNLEIPEKYYLKDVNTTASLLLGLFSADGCINNKGRVTYKTASRKLVKQVQMMLSSIGIRSYISTNKAKEVEFENGVYECKESYDINITKDIGIFLNKVGFLQKYKTDLLKKFVANHRITAKETFTKVVNKEYLGDFEVFDITVDNSSHTYWTGGLSVSNCSEQPLEDGETCCLAECYLSMLDSYEEAKQVLFYLYRICKHSLMLKCHHKKTNDVVHKNMRMGLGLTGVLQATEEQKSWCDKLYKELRKFDKQYSRKHGFPESIKLTTIKPSGTLSLLPGVTPGCHPGYAQYMIRRIQMASNNKLVEVCKKNGYNVEYRLNLDGSIDLSTVVVEFPFRYPEGTVLAKDTNAISQLEVVKWLQEKWSDNAVSCTIYYKKEELPEIKKYLTKNYKNGFKAISFLLHSEHGFKQAPFEEITKEQYDEMIAKVKPITDQDIQESLDLDLSTECVNGACPIR